MASEIVNDKIAVCVEFRDTARLAFQNLKRKLAMENNNDVIRYAIVFTEKRTK
jgi:hypothetical protein